MPKKKIRVLTASFLAAVFVITAGFAVQGHVRAAQYRRLLDNGYLHAFAELTTASSELEVALTKMSHATSPALFASLCAQAYSKAQAAQAALGELPYGNVELEQTAAFLARAGDYAMALAQGNSAELVCSDEHRDTLYQLSQAAGELSLTLETIQAQLTAGAIQPEDLAQAQDQLAADDGSGQVNGGSAFQSVESDFPEVPTLIYDGPFSQHLDGRTPRMLKGLPQVTEEEARQAAASFLGLRPEVFTLTAQSEGNLPAYGFTAMVDGGQLYIQVTCQGGQILEVFSSRTAGETVLSRAEGCEKAAAFLAEKGYANMAPSYFMEQDGVLAINFAPVESGVYCYPDLVQVSVALDTGEIVGFEAAGYLTHHGSRDLPSPTVDAQTAQALVDDSLTVLSHQLALIPTGGDYEVLCHEFKCQAQDGTHVLIYVNALTGQQQHILLLLEDENGTLVL
mgnify:FL=1